MRVPSPQSAIVVRRSASSHASTSNQRVRTGGRFGHDRQANAGAGDRRTDVDGLGIVGRRDAQPPALFAFGNGGHSADIGDDSGKHQFSRTNS
jgi:hypothetical protein